MKIVNPTPNEITVQIEGIKYTVEAQGELKGVPEAHAAYWRDKLHEFLILEEDEVVETADVKKEEAPKEEAPKAETKKADAKKDK